MAWSSLPRPPSSRFIAAAPAGSWGWSWCSNASAAMRRRRRTLYCAWDRKSCCSTISPKRCSIPSIRNAASCFCKWRCCQRWQYLELTSSRVHLGRLHCCSKWCERTASSPDTKPRKRPTSSIRFFANSFLGKAHASLERVWPYTGAGPRKCWQPMAITRRPLRCWSRRVIGGAWPIWFWRSLRTSRRKGVMQRWTYGLPNCRQSL